MITMNNILLIVISLVTFLISKQVISIISSYYMDEPFHTNQTWYFYDFILNKWEEKLTTFPLTFLITAIVLRVLNFFSLPFIHVRQVVYLISLLKLNKLNTFSERLFFSSSPKFYLLIYLLPINFFFIFCIILILYQLFLLSVTFIMKLLKIRKQKRNKLLQKLKINI